MATFTVTTNADVVDANDGLISLREAVEMARQLDGADTIQFGARLNTVSLGSGALVIASGERLTIDSDRNNDGIADVTIDAKDLSHHFTIEAGTVVTLEGLTLSGGNATGAAGSDGAAGAQSSSTLLPGVTGDVGGVGAAAAGSIVNSGDLSLVHTKIVNSRANGGAGGVGGVGGAGANGEEGTADGGGFGQTGGQGGTGGMGGLGGASAGGIINYGTLRLTDVALDYVTGIPGYGGVGGAGGRGGNGGDAVSDNNPFPPFPSGGNGGRGGDGGQTGASGDAAGLIINYGTLSGSYATGNVGVGFGTEQATSSGGQGGSGGQGFGPGDDGTVGASGAGGIRGSGGGSEIFLLNLGTSSANLTTGGMIYVNGTDLVRAEGDSGATTFTFHINCTEAFGQEPSVDWAVTPFGSTTADDFVGGLPSGTVKFASGQKSIAVTFQVAGDRAFEADEFFNVTLSNVQNAGLGTSSVRGAILSDDVLATVYDNPFRTGGGEKVFTLTQLGVVTTQLNSGDLVDIDPAAAIALGQLTIGGDDVTFSANAGTTGLLKLADGLTRIRLGGTANLAVTGNGDDNSITGNAGNNAIDGAGGADTMAGLTGDDVYKVDNMSDQVREDANGGVDTVLSSVNFTLAAGQEVERLYTSDDAGLTALRLTGNDLVNTLKGNAGANILNGRGGADVLQGLGGNDTYVVDLARDKVIEAAGGGFDTVVTTVDYTLEAGQEIERLFTPNVTDVTAVRLKGNEIDNVMRGNAGANVLDGGGGGDTMMGERGNDVYVVDSARDRVSEGAGEGLDTVKTSVSFTLAAGQDIERLYTTDDAGASALRLTGNEINNTLEGNAGANTLDGGGGVDTMVGLGGNDTYFVDAALDRAVEAADRGLDIVMASVDYTLTRGQSLERLYAVTQVGTEPLKLTGNEIDNIVRGNAGANVVDGGAGRDTLFGLGGQDVFAFSKPFDAVDRIVDFSAVDDTIQLSRQAFTALSAGHLNESAFKDLRNGPVDADDRIIYDGRAGALFYDEDGSGATARIAFATFDNKATISHTDFLVV